MQTHIYIIYIYTYTYCVYIYIYMNVYIYPPPRWRVGVSGPGHDVGRWSLVDGRFRGSIGWWIGSSLGAPTHLFRAGSRRLATARDRLRLRFTSLCSTSCWNQFFSDFDANLTPTWPPTWGQNRSKIDPRAVQNQSQIAFDF